jgi:hypothetical protein
MGHELLQKIGNKLNELDYHSLDYPNLQADLNVTYMKPVILLLHL